MTPSIRKIHRWLPVFGLLLLAGCASAPEPRSEIHAAEQAIAAAREVRAEQFAPDELRRARVRLEASREAVAQRKHAQAVELAAQAEADAELAAALSRAAAWRAEVEAKSRRNADLRRTLSEGGR